MIHVSRQKCSDSSVGEGRSSGGGDNGIEEVFLKSDGLRRETLQTAEVRDRRIGHFRRYAIPFPRVPSDLTLKKNGAAVSIDR